jgi:small-conductance mechanosensitive channel
MSAADLGIPFAELLSESSQRYVKAAVILAVAVTIAFTIDRAFARRGRMLADKVIRGGISQEADTRLRFIRRLVWLVIVLIGIFSALSQFTGISGLARSVLASGALAAAIIGFAARQTLANLVAGIMLAITQPLRVGDWVTFEDNYGVVEDVRLNFTVLRTLGDQRIVIPNEMLASGVLRNDTLDNDAVGIEVSLWLAPSIDAEKALAALREHTDQSVTLAEVAPDGIRIAIGGERVAPSERAKREAEVRAACLARLRAAGLIGGAEEAQPRAAAPS